MKLNEIIETFNTDQKQMFKIMNENNLYQFRVPTGVGKGYTMIAHILYSIIKTKHKKFIIASHRLSLNNQHLKDLIEFFVKLDLIPKVRFLTVGSQSLNINKILDNYSNIGKDFNNKLFNFNINRPIKNKIDERDIFKTSLIKDDINNIINKNDIAGFKTVIISTYNSLGKLEDIENDIIYLDEAHTLASEDEESDFKNSFQLISSKKKFFFTATPKDVEEQLLKEGLNSNIFLMNNTEIFGDMFEVKFAECVRKGYITSPVVHIAHPSSIEDGKDYDSIENKCKFVLEVFEAHEKWLKSSSNLPNEIEPKILVRCESVPYMWKMHEYLTNNIKDDIIVCAGASYNKNNFFNHYINKNGEPNRDEFIKKIQKFSSTQKVIILQFDIFSEGINVPGISGVMFLQGKMPSMAKVIQNVGRSTRLHHIDRKKYRNGNIQVGDEKWIKPKCAVIIPYWDTKSQITMNILSDRIKALRDSWEFDPHFIVSIGDDMGEGNPDEDFKNLNKLDDSSKRIKMIDEITQEIEKLDKKEINLEENNRLQKMTDLEFFKEINKSK